MSRFLVKVTSPRRRFFLVLDERVVDELCLNSRKLPFDLKVVCPVCAVEEGEKG